jgi:hypothetical protein
MSSNLIITLEIGVTLGVTFGIGFWELYKLKRDKDGK